VRRLLEPGLEADVPEGWTVRPTDDVIELVPPANDGAGHISTFWRDGGETAAPGEAVEILSGFAESEGWAPLTEPAEHPHGHENLAVATYRDRKGMVVNAAVRIGTRRMLFFTYVASTEGDPDRETAMQIFSSVSAEPDS
jgi:hypothetical protein